MKPIKKKILSQRMTAASYLTQKTSSSATFNRVISCIEIPIPLTHKYLMEYQIDKD